ncbi:MAG: alpha/beta hydrolase-fold protein [Candidatus Eisenbacteria bacterium]
MLGEARRINVYRAPSWQDSASSPRPVLYMPDGGLGEDFLHVAGLLQVGIGNGTLRPLLLVGIENTQRRRDLTGPSDDPRDLAIAPRVGGSAAFRAFLRDELFPAIAARWPVTRERAIVGESLAGLFVVETLFEEPTLFDTYLAFDPSLWWRHAEFVGRTPPRLDARKRLALAHSSEPELARLTRALADSLARRAPANLTLDCEAYPGETHATIYHPAAIAAFRRAFAADTASH